MKTNYFRFDLFGEKSYVKKCLEIALFASSAAAQIAVPSGELHTETAAQVGATVVAKVPIKQAIVLVPKKPSLEQYSKKFVYFNYSHRNFEVTKICISVDTY